MHIWKLLIILFLGGSLHGQINSDRISTAQGLIGLQFDEIERDSMVDDLSRNLAAYKEIHRYSLENSVPPAIQFSAISAGMEMDEQQFPIIWSLPEGVKIPPSRSELAFYSVPQLASLIRDQKVTSVELTKLYLDRLKKYGDSLHCVVSLTEELALKQARKADLEIRAGLWRGPLHGIPYGLKDLLAVPDYKTTWGAAPYQDQELSDTATVYQKLRQSGAVLVAKLSMGALAWGDVWFEGKTRNPWNLAQGSSGSSAGSASATAAGLVAFSIGTETWGSIVSPSTRCGVTGLRPTFGRVSRHGAMALSWSMDKIGPICRTAEGCAMVFNTIRGADNKDMTCIDVPFNYYSNIDLSQLKVGYFKRAFDNSRSNIENDQRSLEVLRELGAELIPVDLPQQLPINALSIILSAEAAAAFDELTRTNQDSLLVRQIKRAWPNVFRASRFIPAVEYINANRIRSELMRQMHAIMQEVDVLVSPSFGGNQLLITNLTGHPCVVVPNGFNESGGPASISFLGNLFDEANILAVARAYQEATTFDEQHPQGFN